MLSCATPSLAWPHAQAQLLHHRGARGAAAPAGARADAAVTVTLTTCASGCDAKPPAGAASPASAGAGLASTAVIVDIDARGGGCDAPAPAAPAAPARHAYGAITVCASAASCVNKACTGTRPQALAQQLGSAGAAADASGKPQAEAPVQRSSPASDATDRDAASEGPPTPRRDPEGLTERCGSEDASQGAAGAAVAGAGDPNPAEGSSDGGRAMAHVTPIKRSMACGAAEAAPASPDPAGVSDAAAAAHATPTKRAKAGCSVQGAHLISSCFCGTKQRHQLVICPVFTLTRKYSDLMASGGCK